MDLRLGYEKIISFLKEKEVKIFKKEIENFLFLETNNGKNNNNIAIRIYFRDRTIKEIIFRYNINITHSNKTFNEYKALKLLDGVVTSQILYFSKAEDNFFSRNIVIMEYIEGIFIKPIFFNREDLDSLIKSMRFIHNFNIPNNFSLGRVLNISFYLDDLNLFFKNTNFEYINNIRILFNQFKDVFDKNINSLDKVSLVHGDLRNHFIKRKDTFYIIDLESVHCGDAAKDIAHFIYFSKLDSSSKNYFLEKYIKNLNNKNKFLDRVKAYLIMEEFIGLKWSLEQMFSRNSQDEKLFYSNLYKLRFKNLLKASKFFGDEDYYLNSGHLYFINN